MVISIQTKIFQTLKKCILALFASGNGSSVSNLKISNIYIESNGSRVATLFGECYGCAIDRVEIQADGNNRNIIKGNIR